MVAQANQLPQQVDLHLLKLTRPRKTPATRKPPLPGRLFRIRAAN